MKSKKIEVGKIYTTNGYGDLEVIAYRAWDDVDVRFVSTGYEAKVQSSSITSGGIKDPLFPYVYGVGFIGIGKHRANKNGRNQKSYKAWSDMLQRCYCPKSQERRPTYRGCRVADEWLNYQVFCRWFNDNYIEGFHLDKDKLSGSARGKLYSPDTCCFISSQENAEISQSKSFKIVSPLGVTHEVLNMSAFCRDNNLDKGNLSRVLRGERGHHNGWCRFNDE